MNSLRVKLTALLLFCLGVPAFAQTSDHPTVGYAQDSFFLRSADDNFILIPSGRLQLDFLGYQDAGHDRAPNNSFFPRRARLELFGTLMKHWDFQIGAELTGQNPSAADIYVNANYTPYANVQLGQFDVPFTLENRTSDKYTDFQERATTVRGFGFAEGSKALGLMVWGQPEAKWAYWSLGVFNPGGQGQFTDRSRGFDAAGRAWIAPLGLAQVKAFQNVWVGGGVYTGNRSWEPANQPDHAPFSDEARFVFFTPTYTSVANAQNPTPSNNNIHLGQDGDLFRYAFELNAPIDRFVLKAEYLHTTERIREVDVQGKLAPRMGRLNGEAGYIRLSYFVWGDPLINGLAGTQNPPRLFGALKPNKTEDALQLTVQWERLAWTYAAEGDPSTNKLAGDYGLDVLGVGANYWLTKRVRLTSNFLYNIGSGKTAHPLAGNRFYEVTGRVALAL